MANTFTIYSAQSFTAPANVGGGSTFQYPVMVDLTAFLSSSGFFVPNFSVTTGTTAPGPNAGFNFRYIFSNNGSYTPSTSQSSLNSASIVYHHITNIPSLTYEYTPQIELIIGGSFLYCWLDLIGVGANFTLSATGYSTYTS